MLSFQRFALILRFKIHRKALQVLKALHVFKTDLDLSRQSGGGSVLGGGGGGGGGGGSDGDGGGGNSGGILGGVGGGTFSFSWDHSTGDEPHQQYCCRGGVQYNII
jgi:hypothetical protein